MDLELVSLKMVDFMAFVGVHEVRFNTVADGLHYVRGRNLAEPSLGSNGAAKSTIWHALTWCLFGRTVEGLRNPDIRSWQGKRASKVTVRVRAGGKRKRITRSTFPNRLRINGKDARQEQVEKLLGLTYDLFVHTLLLGQEQPLFMDLAPGPMLQIFSDVLGLSKWEERSARAADKARELGDKARNLETKLAAAGAAAETLEKQAKEVRRHRDSWDDDIAAERKALELDQAELRTKIGILERKVTDAELQEDWQSTELRLQDGEFQKLYDGLFKVRDALVAADERRRGLRRERARLKEDLREASGRTCPTCGQSLNGTDMGRRMAKHRRKLSGTIDEVTEKLKKIGIKRLSRETKKWEGRIEGARGRVEKLKEDVRQIKADLSLWKQGLNEAQVREHVVAGHLETLTKQTNPYSKQLRAIRKNLEEANERAAECARQRRRLLARAGRAEFWVKGFKDVRLHILTEVLEELQFAANSMLEDMGLVDWEMQFSIERETKSGGTRRGINVTVQAPNSKERVKWRAWSGGERQRLRLAGSLALSEVLLAHAGLSPDFEILDEPIQSLSEEGVTALREYLADRGRLLKRKIWYTDHHVVDGQVFASTLFVEKTAGGARFVGV